MFSFKDSFVIYFWKQKGYNIKVIHDKNELDTEYVYKYIPLREFIINSWRHLKSNYHVNCENFVLMKSRIIIFQVSLDVSVRKIDWTLCAKSSLWCSTNININLIRFSVYNVKNIELINWLWIFTSSFLLTFRLKAQHLLGTAISVLNYMCRYVYHVRRSGWVNIWSLFRRFEFCIARLQNIGERLEE